MILVRLIRKPRSWLISRIICATNPIRSSTLDACFRSFCACFLRRRCDTPPLPHPLSTSCNSLCSLSESGCLDPALAEEDGGQQDDSNDQFVPQAVIENAEEYWQQGDDDDDESVFQAAEDANEDEDVLDPEEEQIINNTKPAPPGITPLALGTLRNKISNILRHLSIAKIFPRPGLRRDVLKLCRYAARRMGLYPTGKLKKVWISDDTVAAVRAGIWNSVAHDISPGLCRTCSPSSSSSSS